MQFYHPGQKCGNFCLVCKNDVSTTTTIAYLAHLSVWRSLKDNTLRFDNNERKHLPAAFDFNIVYTYFAIEFRPEQTTLIDQLSCHTSQLEFSCHL